MSAEKEVDLAQQMRLGMRRLASGVSVVTSHDADKNRLAMTASSITSLSDTPPSLLVCIHKGSYLAKAIQDTGLFCINLLSRTQQEISIRCASPDENLDRFSVGDWEQDKTSGIYFLQNAQAVFHCEKVSELEHGTHYIFVGNILSVGVNQEAIDPLLYLDGKYLSAGDELPR